MENLLASRTMKDQGTSRLQNLSPEKFGKGAYANLSYTPSKLADNVLFKQVTTQKKMEEGTSKLRQSQALNGVFKDRLSQLQEQRDGIQKSLTSQIVMYKKMLHQMEQKNQLRIKSIQQNFNIEMQRLLDQKQEEAKYSQSEKELLENRIYELQQMVANLRNDLSNVDGNYENMKNQKQKLQIKLHNLQKRLEDTQKQAKIDAQKAKYEIEQLQKKLYSTQADWKNKFQKGLHEKDKQRQNLQRLHRTELQKLQHKRAQQALLKNQEFKQLAATFQKETNRLNDIINKKQEVINKLNQLLQNQKEKAFNQSKVYENQINNLTHEKLRYKDELSKADIKNQKLQLEISDLKAKMAQQKDAFESYTDRLKQQLELNQLNYIRERDRNVFMSQDLQKEITRLRIQNDSIGSLAGENTVLHKQLRNMKDLLLESSLQMERCKQQFVRLGRQKDKLSIRLRETSIQNQTLHRIKNQREDEARGWRQSYYIQKNRS